MTTDRGDDPHARRARRDPDLRRAPGRVRRRRSRCSSSAHRWAPPASAPLRGHFPDRTSSPTTRAEPSAARRTTRRRASNPDQHGDDLHRIIQEVGGPVDLFASSGGAVNALALVAKHPEDVRILVAHEPPLASILPDSDDAKAAVRAIQSSYQAGGFGAGMAHFIAITGHRGPFTADVVASAARPIPRRSGCRPRTMAAGPM